MTAAMRSRDLSRRDVLKWGAAAGVALAAPALPVEAQAPKWGGIFRIRGEDPVGFDPQLVQSYRTMTNLSFTHSRLVKIKAGAGVPPGSTPLEGDLAESWTQPGPTTYVFRLRKGVRWHTKPPVDGRELTAEDVKYTYERFLATKQNPHRGLLEQVEKIEALDRHTVRFTLTEPFAWFPHVLASTVMWIVPREAVEKFGDLRRPEACIGTGPFVLERYEPAVRLTFVRNPSYFLPGLPYVDGVEVRVDEDPSSRLATWLAGGYDFAPEYDMVVRRSDLDVVKQRKPKVQTAEFVWLVGGITFMKLDQEPFRDIRVRRAFALAQSWKEILETNAFSLGGHGVPSPAIPPAFRDWSLPISQMPPEARRLYEQDLEGAKKLLAEAGHGKGLRLPYETTPGFGPDYMDGVQIALKNWKAAGIDLDLRLKEYPAAIASILFGKFDRMAGWLVGAWDNPDSYLHRHHSPGQPTNASGVNDPRVNEMIRLQRRTFDEPKRREIVYDLQRYLATQVYHLYGPAATVLAGWEPYVKNFGPNFGHDYGGRLMVAWIDK
jgi:peptide/nickel transport system substrate-binding protein